jgi:hypothetical protein
MTTRHGMRAVRRAALAYRAELEAKTAYDRAQEHATAAMMRPAVEFLPALKMALTAVDRAYAAQLWQEAGAKRDARLASPRPATAAYENEPE